MTDPSYDIRNDSCMYAYYLSKRHHTSNHATLKQNLTVRIIIEMYSSIKQHSLPRVLASPKLRKKALNFLETATRLAVLLIIDNMLDSNTRNHQQATKMLDEIKSIFRYFTANLYLIKIFLPFFQSLFIGNFKTSYLIQFFNKLIIFKQINKTLNKYGANKGQKFNELYEQTLYTIDDELPALFKQLEELPAGKARNGIENKIKKSIKDYKE